MTSTTKTKNLSRRKIKALIMELIMILVACIILYPFLIMIFVSLKSTKEALLNPNSFPSEFHFENFPKAWEIMNYDRVFANTFLITAFSLLGIVIISGLAGYIIAWSKHKKFYNIMYVFFLLGIMIPFYTALVPLVKLMSDIKMTNSIFGMILYYSGRNIPMAVFLYVGFIRGVSGEILEAGKIDGANIWKLYWRVLFPILKPITTTIIILDALHIWNDFLFPRLMLTKTNLRTIALSQFYFTGEYGNKWELAFAAYLLTILPILILYFVMQKNIIKGVAAGAVKG
ncbi:ABC transporter permease subunit [Anaerocolumna sedimenticola]|uniref:ABC transporter permease subunit n=1 Tax=Anaerocolumna sedimenticola TaxID=2696063 RepID=A0A6P1THU9_9FIRM|nr:carbohydrate ABC transporter permease [Anaerocolumna sedimenticola]QHQ59611.1 ABC transporter permease subunit [Anaerocolumna sedimenticola]